MTNIIPENTISRMRLEDQFHATGILRISVTSSNAEDVYELLTNDLESIVDSIGYSKWDVDWVELESAELFSNPDEEEIFIDMHKLDIGNIVECDGLVDEWKILFTLDEYSIVEQDSENGRRYYLINSTTDKTYEMILETCFSLMSLYCEEDKRYILLDELVKLESRVGK